MIVTDDSDTGICSRLREFKSSAGIIIRILIYLIDRGRILYPLYFGDYIRESGVLHAVHLEYRFLAVNL